MFTNEKHVNLHVHYIETEPSSAGNICMIFYFYSYKSNRFCILFENLYIYICVCVCVCVVRRTFACMQVRTYFDVHRQRRQVMK